MILKTITLFRVWDQDRIQVEMLCLHKASLYCLVLLIAPQDGSHVTKLSGDSQNFGKNVACGSLIITIVGTVV